MRFWTKIIYMNDHPNAADSTEALGRTLREQLATVTGGLAPDVYVNAWWDWYLNVAQKPVRQAEILEDAMAKAMDNWNFALKASAGEPLAPAEGDARFKDEAWSQWPFNVLAHGYRNYADWWQQAWSSVPGVARQSEQQLDFVARNALETLSPANYLLTNPELLDTHTGGSRPEPGARLLQLAGGHRAHARR